MRGPSHASLKAALQLITAEAKQAARDLKDVLKPNVWRNLLPDARIEHIERIQHRLAVSADVAAKVLAGLRKGPDGEESHMLLNEDVSEMETDE